MHKFLLLVPLILGCPPQPTPPTPDADAMTPPVSDAAAETTPAPADACGRAEQNLLKLSCKDQRGQVIGAPNLHGVPWAQICRDNKANGVDMKPECLALKTNCAAIEACR
jgi:hypothetical protein